LYGNPFRKGDNTAEIKLRVSPHNSPHAKAKNTIFKNINKCISPFHRAFQFTMCFGPTNALVCNETLIQMSHIKTLKSTPKCFIS
jgi:hypothetical protein